ncbi:MAG TPA: hypothetical protein VH599_01080 [Ktedonobacterales bacterium]|jgi:hypothetical protein
MFLFGPKRPDAGSKRPGDTPLSRRSQRHAASAAVSPEGRRYELALLVAGLPAAGQIECIRRLLPLVEKRPAWNEEDVGAVPAEQCCRWRPFADDRLSQQTPRGLLLVLQTEIESGLRSAATPLWLLNRIVRRVCLLHQGQRVGQVYRELERQLGDARLALEWVSQMVAGLSRVGILEDWS